MWWNFVVGGSVLASAVSTLIGNVSTMAVNTIKTTDQSENNNESKNVNIFRNTNNFNMVRLSKYPSRTTIGFF